MLAKAQLSYPWWAACESAERFFMLYAALSAL
jgi:hypothetical protein